MTRSHHGCLKRFCYMRTQNAYGWLMKLPSKLFTYKKHYEISYISHKKIITFAHDYTIYNERLRKYFLDLQNGFRILTYTFRHLCRKKNSSWMVIVKKIQRTIYRNTIQLDPLFGKGPLHFVFFKVLLHFSRKHGEKRVTQVRGTEEQHCVTKEVIISRIRFKRRFNASLKTIFF